jgi:biopolymer transport protein ExbB
MQTVEGIKEILLQLGTAWVLWLLGALSVASAIVFVERLLAYRAAGVDLEAIARKLGELLSAGRHAEAVRTLRASPAVAARIAAAGIELSERGSGAAEHAMKSAVALERSRLEKRLAFLATLGNNAPFLGLLGTVIGIILAFEELGHGAPGHGSGSAASEGASQAVMGAIAEALVATAVGLVVALPAVAAYNYLQRRVTTLIEGSEVLSRLVLAYTSDPASRPSSPPEVPRG